MKPFVSTPMLKKKGMKMMNLRRVFVASAGFLAFALAAAASAQSWPAKPIRVIVPFPPAGGTDVLTRQLAEKLAAATKWTLVIDNKPGAGGNIGLEALAKSAPDGYTLAMGQTANLAINPALYSKMPFDALKDFAPLALVSAQPVVLVVAADSPYRSLADVVAAARSKRDGLSMASAGSGTVGHLAGELFARKAGVTFLHIPYKGASPAVTDLMGRQVDIMFANTQSVMTLVTAGKLRALAVSSAQRIKPLPAVPTISESGYRGFEAVTWSGLIAPAGVPADIVAKLNAEVNKVLARADFLEKLAAEGSQPLGGSPQQFADFMREEHAKWGVAVRASGAKAD
jgi:tripartite-type tricarboxylate transporter receptor subunit TctC